MTYAQDTEHLGAFSLGQMTLCHNLRHVDRLNSGKGLDLALVADLVLA